MTEDWFAILNPKSAGGRALRDRDKITSALRQAGLTYELTLSSSAGHSLILAQEAASRGYRKFIAIGGDGTVNEVVNGAFRSGAIDTRDLILGAVPLGRGNDWARGHRIPRDYAAAAQLIASDRPVAHDIGVVNGAGGSSASRRYFLNVAGAGFDAHVVSLVQGNRWGSWTYFAALPGAFASYTAPAMSISADNFESAGDVFVIFCAIGRYCGGGMLVAPKAVSSDGLLDVVVVENISKWELLLNIRRLFDGTIGEHPKTCCLRVPEIEISAPAPVTGEADGELVGNTPFRIESLEKKIQVMIPA